MNSIRLRYLLRERDIRGCDGETVLSVYRDLGVVPKAERDDNFNKTPEDLGNYKLVLPGDVVVNKMKAWQGSVAVSSFRGIVSGDYLVCSLTAQVDRSYLHHLLRSHALIKEYRARAKGIRPQQWRLYWEDLADISVLMPPLLEQTRIGRFLDAELARVDKLMTKKRRMIDLARARFELLVRQTLSDPSWPSLPLKRRWKVIDCKHITPIYVDEGIPVVSPGDTTPGRLDLARCHRFVDATDFRDLTAGGRRPQRGDIIYSRNASVGIASYVDTDRPFCMGQDVCIIRSNDQEQRFLTFALNTFGLDQLELTKVGSTFTRINVAQISELRVPCPQVEVQRRVADYLDRLASTAEQIVGRLYRQLALLQEHRQSMITAAVTGEIP